MANEVKINLTVEERAAIKAIGKVIKSTKTMEKTTVKSVGKMDIAFGSFVGTLASNAVGAAFRGLKSGIMGVVEASKSLETIRTQFTTILGSAQLAQKQLEELQDFAATTPFQIEGLSLATRQLLSFGVVQEDVIPTLRQLGDLAAGTGSAIDELTIPFGRLVSTQKLTLIELDKFADRGINLFGALSEKTGISLKNIRDEISKGRVPFEAFTEALNDLTKKGGTFFGATEAQSKTLSGVLSTLDDNFFNLKSAIGDAFAPSLIEGASELTKIIQNLTQTFKDNGPAIASTAAALAKMLIITPSKFIANLLEGDTPVKRVEELNEEIGELKEKLEDMAKINGKTILASRERTIKGEIAALERELSLQKMLVEESRKLSGGGGADVTETQADKVAKKAAAAKAAREKEQRERDLEAEKVQLDAIAVLRQEANDAEIEREALKSALEGENKIRDFEQLSAKYGEEQAMAIMHQAKIAEIKNGEVAADEKRRALVAKAEVKDIKGKNKRDRDKFLNTKKWGELSQREQVMRTQSTFAAIATLQSSGNKTLFTIGKAAATANHIVASIQAVDNALKTGPPPVNFILAGLVGTAMAIQGAKLASAKPPGFATGGVIGGFQGASMGGDNAMAQVRNGEMILTAQDQKNLFEDIREGGNARGSNNAELIQALNTPVVVNIDGREVARATRNASRDGFQVAV